MGRIGKLIKISVRQKTILIIKEVDYIKGKVFEGGEKP